jgi:single-stranded DNA-specific DHH superfamily exonuclease
MTMVFRITLDCGIKSIDHVAYAKAKILILSFVTPQTRKFTRCRRYFGPKRDDCPYPMMNVWLWNRF